MKKLFYSHRAELLNLRRQLKKTKNKKQKTKRQAQITELEALIAGRTPLCLTGGGSGGGGNVNSLKFNFSGATALALADYSAASATFKDSQTDLSSASGGGQSNLRKVLPGGSTVEALESGTASIDAFLVGPNDKLYVLFRRTCNGNPQACANVCLLGEVDTTSGFVSCIDSTLDSISWSGSSNSLPASSKPLQFDSEGNLYYRGSGNGMMQILRKYNTSTKTTEDLITENNSLSGFLVMADGSVLYSGSTNTSGASWLRKRRTTGYIARIREFDSYSGVDWMSVFPDGRVYLSGAGLGDEIDRMRQDAEELEPITWNAYTGFDQGYDYSYYTALHTDSGSVYRVSGRTPNLRLSRLFPVPHRITSSVERIVGIKPVLSNLIIYGKNPQGDGKLILYNLTSGQEQNLIGDEELEIYRVEFLPSDNAVQFDAQRFSDGKYVLCTVYLDEDTRLACSPTGSVKLLDFQSISTPGVRIPSPIKSPTPIPMIEADFTGAKVLSGNDKIKADGTIEPAIKFSEGRRIPSFRSDNLNNIWIQNAYLTDQDTKQCTLAKVDRTTGLPACVYSGDESVNQIQSRSDGGTFFITTSDTSNQTRYTLYFHQGGAGTAQLASWLRSGVAYFDASITSTGSLLLASRAYWLRNYQTNGQFADLGVIPQGPLARLADGRILVPAYNSGWSWSPYRLLAVSQNGETVSGQPYAYHSTADYEGEVECTAGPYHCGGLYVSKFLSADARLFGIANEEALISYAPGPVSLVNFSPAFTPLVATASEDTIYMYGTRNDSRRLLAYNIESGAEYDLTGDLGLEVDSMEVVDNKLYLASSSVNNYCDNHACCSYSVVVKPLNGGASSEHTITRPEWCANSNTLDLIPF